MQNCGHWWVKTARKLLFIQKCPQALLACLRLFPCLWQINEIVVSDWSKLCPSSCSIANLTFARPTVDQIFVAFDWPINVCRVHSLLLVNHKMTCKFCRKQIYFNKDIDSWGDKERITLKAELIWTFVSIPYTSDWRTEGVSNRRRGFLKLQYTPN